MKLLVADLGHLPYSDALTFQREVARRRISGEIAEDVLLLVEHPPVVTLGRTAKAANLVASPQYLASHGVELFEVERGGDITFHGPGQLVGYPIIDLKRHRRDLHWYLRQVEESLICGVAEFGISGERNAGYTGVWVSGPPQPLYRDEGDSSTPLALRASSARNDNAPAHRGAESHPPAGGGHPPSPQSTSITGNVPRKVASIGVHARDWVTWHGFALNVNTDLRYFDLIVPCGIAGVTMTTVARELGAGSIDMQRVSDAVVRAFGEVFGLEPDTASSADLVSSGAEARADKHVVRDAASAATR